MKFNRSILRAGWRISGFHKTTYFFVGYVVVYYEFLIFLVIYFTTSLYSVERWMNDGTGRNFEGSGHSRIQECMEGLRTIRRAGIPGNVRTRHLRNITRVHYHDSNLLGPFPSQENPAPWNWFFTLIQIIPHSIAQCKTGIQRYFLSPDYAPCSVRHRSYAATDDAVRFTEGLKPLWLRLDS